MSLRPFASIKTNLCVLFTTKGFDFNFDIHIDFDFDFDFNFDSNSATNQIDSLRFQKKTCVALSSRSHIPNASPQKRAGSSYALSARFNAASSVFLQSYARLRPPLLPHTDSWDRSKSRSGSSHNISSHTASSGTCNRADSSGWRAYPTPHAAQTRAGSAGSEPASLPRVLSDAPARHAPHQPPRDYFYS